MFSPFAAGLIAGGLALVAAFWVGDRAGYNRAHAAAVAEKLGIAERTIVKQRTVYEAINVIQQNTQTAREVIEVKAEETAHAIEVHVSSECTLPSEFVGMLDLSDPRLADLFPTGKPNGKATGASCKAILEALNRSIKAHDLDNSDWRGLQQWASAVSTKPTEVTK